MDETGTGQGDWRDQAQAQLQRITGRMAAKKRATVVAIVETRLAGKGLDHAFIGRIDTCSRNVWHTKWKRDPIIAAVLDDITELALSYQAGAVSRALAEAAERLALATPQAASTLIALLADQNAREQRLAAVAILDRASSLTAAKAGDLSRLSDDELEELAAGK